MNHQASSHFPCLARKQLSFGLFIVPSSYTIVLSTIFILFYFCYLFCYYLLFKKIINGFRRFWGYKKGEFQHFLILGFILNYHKSQPLCMYIYDLFIHWDVYVGGNSLDVHLPTIYLVQNRKKENIVKFANLNFLPDS